MKTTQMSFHGWIDNQAVLYPYEAVLLNIQSKEWLIYPTMDKSQKHNCKLKNLDTEGYMLYVSMYVAFWKRHRLQGQRIDL